MTLGLFWAVWSASFVAFGLVFAVRLAASRFQARGVWTSLTPLWVIPLLFSVVAVVYGAQQLVMNSTAALSASQPPYVLLVAPLALFAIYALVREAQLIPVQRSLQRAAGALVASKAREAEDIYDRLVNARGFRTASRANLWFNKALAQVQQDHFIEAAASCEQAIALRPRRALFWALKALALARARRSEDALVACERVAALPSREALSWAYVANALQRLGRPADALAACDQAELATGGDARAVTQVIWATRAMAFNVLGRYQEGLVAADHALSAASPGARYPVRAAVARVAALAGLQRLEEARVSGEQSLAAVETLLADRPQDVDAVDAKAFLSGLLGRESTN